MFRIFGTFATKYRYFVIGAWIAAAALLMLVAPPLDEVSSTDQADFLPADAPFVHAQTVYEETFPDLFSPSSTMLVIVNERDGGSVRDETTWLWMETAVAWFTSEAAPDNITDVIAPTTDPDFADALISPDGQIALISLSLNTIMDDIVTAETVHTIDEWLAEQAQEFDGFSVYQTGEAGLNTQAEEATFTTMDRTLVITFALVIVALLVIYRSPVSPLVPLFTVTVAFVVAIGLIGLMADWGVIVAVAQVSAMLIVVMYGAGTDYCLFLISRFREEMAGSGDVTPATKNTLRLVGEAISTSAGTTFVGFMSLLFAEMGLFRSAGPMLAIGIAVSLFAGLTLTPALLATLGNRAFWPGKASHRDTGRFYEMTSKLASERALLTTVVIVAAMVPFSLYGMTRSLNFDFVSELPGDLPAVTGYNLLRGHMGGGELFPLDIVMTGRDTNAIAGEIVALTDDLLAVENVADVRSLHLPLGAHDDTISGLLTVEGQLAVMTAEDEGGQEAIDLTEMQGITAALVRYFDAIERAYPAVADEPNLATARAIVDGGIIALGLRQDEFTTALDRLATTFAGMDDSTFMPPTGEGDVFADLAPLVTAYTAQGSTAYRLEVILDNPLGDATDATVTAIRALLATYQSPDGEAVLSGFPAMQADIIHALGRDQGRVYLFVLAGVFVMLTVLLRSLVAPLYLIATVLLSYTTTLGLTALFFDAVYGVDKLSWMLPTFVFVFLVGLGVDYSIFLFSRIREEVAEHGIREGVHVAVAATGAIITSAAIILAGTFAGLVAGDLMLLKQLGFAVAVGVLIDAFIVRTILDPALATAFGKWTWWPGGIPTAKHTHAAAPQHEGAIPQGVTPDTVR